MFAAVSIYKITLNKFQFYQFSHLIVFLKYFIFTNPFVEQKLYHSFSYEENGIQHG